MTLLPTLIGIMMCFLICREYVVDLVGEPGNVHGPDSSINGAYVSSMPSPFQICHLKESQSPYMDDIASSESVGSNDRPVNPENIPYSGMLCFTYL